MGAVEVLDIGESYLQSTPTTLTHNELRVAHPASIYICSQLPDEFFMSYDLAKFHFRLVFRWVVNDKNSRFN
jgi:hypothetical protein